MLLKTDKAAANKLLYYITVNFNVQRMAPNTFRRQPRLIWLIIEPKYYDQPATFTRSNCFRVIRIFTRTLFTVHAVCEYIVKCSSFKLVLCLLLVVGQKGSGEFVEVELHGQLNHWPHSIEIIFVLRGTVRL